MTKVIMNWGTGPLKGATLAQAYDNLEALLLETGFVDARWCRDVDAEEEGGRFSFLVTCPDPDDLSSMTGIPVDMPGLPLEKVRFTGGDQNILDFPRLYVNGNSYVWCFAVSVLRAYLKGER